jgi:hypothetical protein
MGDSSSANLPSREWSENFQQEPLPINIYVNFSFEDGPSFKLNCADSSSFIVPYIDLIDQILASSSDVPCYSPSTIYIVRPVEF